MMSIYDCFMYYDEDLLLDLRLNVLNPYVEKFVITEATYTHNGNKKTLQFDIKNFQKFKDKIIYLVVDEQPKNILELNDGDTDDRMDWSGGKRRTRGKRERDTGDRQEA